jgi:hypothetical protein
MHVAYSKTTYRFDTTNEPTSEVTNFRAPVSQAVRLVPNSIEQTKWTSNLQILNKPNNRRAKSVLRTR